MPRKRADLAVGETEHDSVLVKQLETALAYHLSQFFRLHFQFLPAFLLLSCFRHDKIDQWFDGRSGRVRLVGVFLEEVGLGQKSLVVSASQ